MAQNMHESVVPWGEDRCPQLDGGFFETSIGR